MLEVGILSFSQKYPIGIIELIGGNGFTSYFVVENFVNVLNSVFMIG